MGASQTLTVYLKRSSWQWPGLQLSLNLPILGNGVPSHPLPQTFRIFCSSLCKAAYRFAHAPQSSTAE
jgi:hypothetical protein